MKKIFFFLLFFTLFVLTYFPKFFFTYAASESILNFDTIITAHQNGSFDVREDIRYDFGSNERHGIYRDIPKVSKVGDLYRVIEITFDQILRDGQSEKYSLTESGDKVSVKIGDPNKTIAGVHTYVISYQVRNGVGSNYADHDEIYWNATGNEWQVPISAVSVSVTTDFGTLPNKVACFSGVQGAKNKDCTYLTLAPFNPVKTTKVLKSYEGLSVVYGFPVNTFPKSILQKNPPSSATTGKGANGLILFLTSGIMVIVPLLLNLVLAPGILFWYLKNKRKSRFGPVTVNFDIPKDWLGKRLAPAEAGTIDTAKLERDDVVATIFDLAIRKYIKIRQVEEKSSFLGIDTSKKDFIVEKLKSYNEVAPFEKILLNRLFKSGDIEVVGSLRGDFYKTFGKMDDAVFSSLISKLYYSKNPKTQRVLLITGAFFSLFLYGFLLAGVLFLLSIKLNGRTAKGDEIDWKIDGLKLFLKNMSREYKWHAEELHIVEKMIPYAIALGYIDKYMEQLKIIKLDYKPDWYSGNLAFYAVSSSMFSSMNSGFTTSAPSSSSGFGGGGSSGGGGGGGGGGSW